MTFEFKGKRYTTEDFTVAQVEFADEMFSEFRALIWEKKRNEIENSSVSDMLSELVTLEVSASQLLAEIRKAHRYSYLIAILTREVGCEFSADTLHERSEVFKELPALVGEAVLNDFFSKEEFQNIVIGGYFVSLMNRFIFHLCEKMKETNV